MSVPMTALTKKDSGWKEVKLPEEAYQALGVPDAQGEADGAANRGLPQERRQVHAEDRRVSGGQGQRSRAGSGFPTATEDGRGRGQGVEGHCLCIEATEEAREELLGILGGDGSGGVGH
jgi:hypothetical protein